jgi:hypothetical protein
MILCVDFAEKAWCVQRFELGGCDVAEGLVQAGVVEPAEVLDARGGQRIRLAALPFISAHRMVRAFEDPGTWTAAYADRIRKIIDILAGGLAVGAQDRDVHVFSAHIHVAGAQVTRSERPYTVSDGYAAQAAAWRSM